MMPQHYDPYDHLQNLTQRIQRLEANQMEIAKGLNHQQETMKTVLEAIQVLQNLYMEKHPLK